MSEIIITGGAVSLSSDLIEECCKPGRLIGAVRGIGRGRREVESVKGERADDA